MIAHIVLASASPSRRDILRRAGIDPLVAVSSVDEEAVTAAARGTDNELRPEQESLLLARTKCEDVASRILGGGKPPVDLILGCDSVFELDGVSYGKPRTPEVAIERWRLMSGRVGVLHTGHWLIALHSDTPDRTGDAAGTGGPGSCYAGSGDAGRAGAGSHGTGDGAHRRSLTAGGVVSTRVRFALMTEDDIAEYVATGEPLHCAGGFTIDGLGAAFVEGVDGDPSNVIGLSLHFLRFLLREVDVPWTALRSASPQGACDSGARDAH